MNATTLLAIGFACGLVFGVGWTRIINTHTRKFHMAQALTQKELLDEALAQHNQNMKSAAQDAANQMRTKFDTFKSGFADILTRLAVKNQASGEIDLTSEINDLRNMDMGAVLAPLTQMQLPDLPPLATLEAAPAEVPAIVTGVAIPAPAVTNSTTEAALPPEQAVAAPITTPLSSDTPASDTPTTATITLDGADGAPLTGTAVLSESSEKAPPESAPVESAT